MQQTNSTPLWRELFNLSYKKPLKTEYQQYEDGSHICLATYTGDWVADFGNEGGELGEVTAKYAALSTNNLHKLAEALEVAKKELRFLNVNEDGSQKANTPVSRVLSQIETALAAIS